MDAFQQHITVQRIAKRVLAELGSTLSPADSECSIATRAASLLAAYGAPDTWYYDCPAFVLLGSRSCLSISGREYQPSQELLGTFNVVSVDLSPVLNGAWGDCARTFCIENGAFAPVPETPEFREGYEAEKSLHQAMASFVTPTTTFGELFAFGNAQIRDLGCENLDFLGNLGHSIASRRENRVYIESGRNIALGSVPFFTFEPHIRRKGGRWGFKHEDIYFFDHGRCTAI